MEQQFALIKGSRGAIEGYFRSITVDPMFLSFVNHVSPFARVAVLSDGIDYPIQQVLRRLGLSSIGIFANHLRYSAEGLSLEFPLFSEACTQKSGVCKCSVMRSLCAHAGEKTILIGDGRSDYCIARSVNYVFAKNSLRDFCASEGITHSAISSFEDVLIEVSKWDHI